MKKIIIYLTCLVGLLVCRENAIADIPSVEEFQAKTLVSPPSNIHYDNLGRVFLTVSPDGVSPYFTYDAQGRIKQQVLDIDHNETISPQDEVRLTNYQILLAHGEVVRRTEVQVAREGHNLELASQHDISVDGLREWITRWGLLTTSSTVYGFGGTKTTTVTYPDNSTAVFNYSQNRLVDESRFKADGVTRIKGVSYAYDAHGRLDTVTDARNGATSYSYDVMDRVLTETKPASIAGASQQVSTNAYDTMGRVVLITLPDTSQTSREYYPNGQLKKESGSQVPKAEYTYDTQGRKKTMTTQGQAGPSVTSWAYNTSNGWLQSKFYPGGDYLSYTYTQGGLLKTRSSGRGITRTYLYDGGGRMTDVDYSDTTPDVVYALNRLGQITSITDGSGTRARILTTDGRLVSETYSGGLLDGAVISREWDAFHRHSKLSFGIGTLAEVNYSYDGASRLESVAAGDDTSTYSYLVDSHLVGGVTTKRGGVTSLVTVSNYDLVERLTSISSSNSGGVATSHAYSYNSLNQRVESVLKDASKWVYQYDPMGQVVSGSKSWADNNAVGGAQYDYDFDGIGNRTSTAVNGRQAACMPNLANQYLQREVPGTIDVSGTALAAATVTVNLQPAQRHGDYYYKGVSLDNSGEAQHSEISVVAVLNDAGPNGEDLINESSGKVFLPKTPEVFTYDEEGNLNSDGRWSYFWDAENRLIRQEAIEGIPPAARLRLEFSYDAESRRIGKKVSRWSGTVWDLESEIYYLYDGWNLVPELESGNVVSRTFVWGLDLSGTAQGAGGVGGLFAIREGLESYYPAYDGNGNVMAMIKASNQSVAARYQYGPFGESLAVHESGISNPFRFSTKYQDAETGLYYYGYRYYNPTSGKWLTRDPLEERGGINLYGFVKNDSIGKWDRLGLDPMDSGLTFPTDAITGPNLLDHINGDANNQSAIADFEAWLERNYSGSLAQGKQSINSDIDAEIRKLCFNKGNTIARQSFSVGPKTQKKNGECPGDIVYMLNIGKFSMYSRNVNITWNARACSYEWTGEVYVEEVTGATRGQDTFNDLAHASGFFHERTVEYASWPILGSGRCSN